MLIIGCDYHPSVQQIAWVDKETGECGERRLRHRAGAEQFYDELKGKQVRVGIEATGHSREKTIPRFSFPCKKVSYFAYWIGPCSWPETTEMVFDGTPAALHANIKSEDDV